MAGMNQAPRPTDLAEILTNRRNARVAREVRQLTSSDHWTSEISELRRQQREDWARTALAQT